MPQLDLFATPQTVARAGDLDADGWFSADSAPRPWPTDGGRPATLGPLGYHVMIRAPWDPAEIDRASGAKGRERLRSLRDVQEQPLANLRQDLLDAWGDLDASDPGSLELAPPSTPWSCRPTAAGGVQTSSRVHAWSAPSGRCTTTVCSGTATSS